MKILHVIPWLAERYGGPAILVPQAVRALIERGHHVEIATTNLDGRGRLEVTTGQLVDWAGAPTTFHSLSVPAPYVTSWPLLFYLLRSAKNFDVIHIHYLYRFHGLSAAIAARLAGVPYVIQAHGSLDPWHRRQKARAKDVYHALVEDPIIRGARGILCTSEREQSHIRALGYRKRTWAIPVGIDVHELRRPGARRVLKEAGITADDRVITFLGRISEKKGVPLLVEAFRRVASESPLAHLVIAGPDEEGIGRQLASTVASAGLSERISFVGPVGGSDKRGLLQRSDVFVLPSADESFGVAVAEALAVGCPVVVSPDVAIEGLVTARGAGIVADRNPDAIADAVVRVLADPVAAASMGTAGRTIVDEHFAWPVVAAQMESMYEAIARTPRGESRRPTRQEEPSRSDPSPRPPILCIRCGKALSSDQRTWHCDACGWSPTAHDGVPIFLGDAAAAEHDELDHHHSAVHKREQAEHFDRSDEEEFETVRPHASPRLYRFLLDEKLRRALTPLRRLLSQRATALVVCGGSGMDAEYLSRAGANVTTSDLSLGAAVRAKTRSDRYALDVESIVADVERLPFAGRSVDVVAVHDGLHHLEDPYAGLAEMARVARKWVVVTEPARAAATRVAIQFGWALAQEEAGNRVARLDPSDVGAFLEARGFSVVRAERYAMYYPHHPGPVFMLLSRPFVFPVVRLAWRVANAVVGRFGNKMVVVAERVPAEPRP